jgi:hypothetical protein
MQTLVSLIPNPDHVRRARQALLQSGIAPVDIITLRRPADVWQQLGGRKERSVVFRHALMGAALGLCVGALYGIPAGLMNCSEVGCPVTISGLLLTAITLFWIFGGAFLGIIMGMDKLERKIYSYVEGVRHGSELVVVKTSDEKAAEVSHILRTADGKLVHSIGGG